MREWADSHGPYPVHPSLEVSDGQFDAAFTRLADRLRGSFPFFHPRYAGQMLKPPHPVAVAGYLAAMLVNSNNHALDGGPATSELEHEVVGQLAAMFGFSTHLGHLTSSGTIANLEALFVARESHPGKAIAYSADAHYTHARMCALLGVASHRIAVDARGRIDLTALEALLATGTVGTVVLTAGTTNLGAVDPIDRVVELSRQYRVRVHVDAAYGGFFTILAANDESGLLEQDPWLAIADCDSVVVDPHKHGLQPYGCGAIMFRDPDVARFYLHDSPYTYYVSDRLHLGEVSLECSRAGAAAAALWLTFQVFPPTVNGLGAILAASRRAALRWADLLTSSPHLALYQPPELDIVTYFPRIEPLTLGRVDVVSQRMLAEGMRCSQDPIFLSIMRTDAAAFLARHPGTCVDGDETRVLRSVLMKPEFETCVDGLHERVELLAERAITDAN